MMVSKTAIGPAGHGTPFRSKPGREPKNEIQSSFMSPSSINTQSLPPLMDPPTASIPRKMTPPPPLTKRLLSLLSPDSNNDHAVSVNQWAAKHSKRDPTATTAVNATDTDVVSSPAESITQAMKSELEDLMSYIDGLTFDDAQNRTPRVDRKMIFDNNDPTPSKPHSLDKKSPYGIHGSHFKLRPSQAIFRDRTNQDASPLGPIELLKQDPAEANASLLQNSGELPRLEPIGSPPPGEDSLYFHDESLPMILSQGSDDDTADASFAERTANVTQSPPSKSHQTTSSPSFISTFRQNGILPPSGSDCSSDSTSIEHTKTSRTKTISFCPVSKDPTPTKMSLNSRINATPATVREDSSNCTRYWEVTPSKDYSSNLDGVSFGSSLLQNRKSTPFPNRSQCENFDLEGDDRFGGTSPIVHDIHEVTNPSEMETPQPAARSIPRLASPENAKKILETAVETLKDARQEREVARQWAQDIKESVQQWVEEQRELIRTESASVAATSAASSAQVQQLESSINKLQNEIARSNSSRSSNEHKLERLLLQQEDQIFAIAKELHAMKDQLALLETGASSKERPIKARLPMYPLKPTGTSFPSLSRRATPKSKHSPLDRYHVNSSGRWSEVSTTSSHGSRTRRKTPNGGHVVDYGNGITKEVHPDGTTVTRFVNGDVETRFSDLSTPNGRERKGIVAYFHNREGVLQITQKDGSVLYEYSNGQMERHLRDGTKVVLFPDGSKTIVTAKQSSI